MRYVTDHSRVEQVFANNLIAAYFIFSYFSSDTALALLRGVF